MHLVLSIFENKTIFVRREEGGTLFCQKCVLLFCTNNCRFSSFSIFHTYAHTHRESVSERERDAHTRVYHSLWLSNLFLLSFFVCLALLLFLAHYAFLQSFALKGQRSVCLPVCACVCVLSASLLAAPLSAWARPRPRQARRGFSLRSQLRQLRHVADPRPFAVVCVFIAQQLMKQIQTSRIHTYIQHTTTRTTALRIH